MIFSITMLKKFPALRLARLYSNRNIVELCERGLINSIFPEGAKREITDLLNRSHQCVYAGFDPTASSLHIGNLLVLIKLLHWQRGGHQVIALLGGATGRIGDPSGRSSDRQQMEDSSVTDNLKGIKENIEKIFDNHEQYLWKNKKNPLKPPIIVNNEEWYRNMDAIDFVGKVGRNFRMGTMLLKQSVQTRLKSDLGMSFTEFTYQIFQAYDWLHLLQKYDCRFQVGGSDQMGNLLSGFDLISKTEKKPVYGMTLPLITTEEGDKFGKSAGNAIWLDENKTSAFSIYQFFLRTKDSEVENLLKYFTFLSLGEIKHLMTSHESKPELRNPQKRLAEIMTVIVHGEEGLRKAEKATEALYSNNIECLLNLSAKELTDVFFGATTIFLMPEPAMTILDLAMKAKCFPTQNDAIRIITAGGFHVNHQKTKNFKEVLSEGAHILPNKLTLIRVGKKNYFIVKWMA